MKGWILKVLKPWAAQRLEWALLYYFARTAKRRRCKKPTGKILIARTDGLGDFVLWLDAQKQLRTMYPDKKLVMMLDATKPTFELAKKCPDIDEVLLVNVHRYVRFFEIFRMRKRSFDQIIQPVYGRTAFTDLLLFSSRADHRVTLDGGHRFLTAWEKRTSDQGYDRVILSAPKGHELIRCGELIRGLGKHTYKAILPRLYEVTQLPKGIAAMRPYIVIYPGGSWKEKCWAPTRFATVCDWIVERTKKKLFLCGGADDYDAAKKVKEAMKHYDAVTIYAGEHDICQSAEVIRHADFVFGNDTGAIHIAAVCRVPSAAIVVGREFGRFFPYGVERRMGDERFPVSIFASMPCLGCFLEGEQVCHNLRSDPERLPCIDEISIEQVLSVLENCL